MIAADVIDRASGALGDLVPRIGGALLLLVVGLLAARLVARLARRGLERVGLDRLGERFGIHDVLVRVGLERSISRLVARALRIALTVVVLMAVVAVLGLGALGRSLNEVVLFLPRVFTALVLVLVGVVLADFARDRIGRMGDQMALGVAVGRAAQVAVLAVFTLTALAQLGIPTAVMTAVAGVVLLAVAFTLALAFGLGGRDVARQVSAGRYVANSFALGETIAVEGIEGEIVRLESAAALVRTADGKTVRVPNHLLLESLVTVRGASAPDPQEDR